jgi:hypothetical protein
MDHDQRQLELSAVEEDREFNDFLARKICRDLDIAEP